MTLIIVGFDLHASSFVLRQCRKEKKKNRTRMSDELCGLTFLVAIML